MKKCFLFVSFLMITLHTFSQANAGPDKTICLGSSIIIGGGTDESGYCYSWKASPDDPAIANLKTAKILVSPTQTTTYTLTVIGENFSSTSPPDAAIITVIENDIFEPSNVSVAEVLPGPTHILDNLTWGQVNSEDIEVEITACSDGNNWHPIVQSIMGNYSIQYRLLDGVVEVTGIGGNSTNATFCPQVIDLKLLTLHYGNWFMVGAVKAHEDLHATRFKPALEAVANSIENLFEIFLTVTDNGQSQQIAINQIKSLPDYKMTLNLALQIWNTEFLDRLAFDHSSTGTQIPDGTGLAYVAEQAFLYPKIATICNYARANNWMFCIACE